MFEGKDVKVLLAQAGSGKGNWNECKIPTPNGIRRFGDLKVNDFVYDRLGFPTRVLGVYPRGLMEAYKVTLSDGRSTVVSLDHLWNINMSASHNHFMTASLELIIYLTRFHQRIWIPATNGKGDCPEITRVEKLPELKEITCIYVDNEEHLYQCDDGIVTHNTHRLIDEVAKELETRRPEEIAFVTFTRKGAEEGLRRVCNKFMLEPDDLPYFRTLHSLTFHALNLKSDQMFGRHDQKIFNSRYGYNVNRCEVNLSKATPTADSQLLDFYDLERSGALTSRQLAEMDIQIAYYKKLTRDYENYKRENKLVDFFDCLLKYVEQGESLPVRIALIDECQDITALQWKVIDKAFSRAEKIIVAGDENQCQPAGSKVLTKEGYKNIEDLTSEDSLITFSQEDYSYYGTRQVSYHPEVAKRPYEGKIVGVHCNGAYTKFTPNHRMIVRWINRDKTLRCVYLMRKGDWFRIGQCQLFNSNGATHFTRRMNIEGADAGWILRICKTKEEALVWEQIYSVEAGIPQISWSKWYTKEMQEKVYDFLPCLEDRAYVLLRDLGRSLYYPMFNHEKNNAKSGGTCISLCEAINLIPEVMALPVYQGKSKVDKDTLWQQFTTYVTDFKGVVYSLDVPKYHTYVTEGGLTVHNSIYTYSGARPDFLIELANKYPVENLAFSYRIPQSVYRLAKAITDFIGDKTKKPFIPRVENKEGSITQLSDIERLTNFIDVDSLCDDKQKTEWYILSRNNCYLKEATDILEEKLIPYWTTDGFFMGGDIMKRIKDYENFRLEGFRDETKRKAFAKKYGITDFTVDFTETNLFTEGRKWVYAAYIEKYGLKKLEEMCIWNPQILVSTVHQVKGGEASNVAFMLDATRRTYGNIFNNIDEELRILYVAVTRTKDNLFLIDSKNGVGYDEILQTIKDENNLKW